MRKLIATLFAVVSGQEHLSCQCWWMGKGNVVYSLNVMAMIRWCGLTCKTRQKKSCILHDYTDGKWPEEGTPHGQNTGHRLGLGKKGISESVCHWWVLDYLWGNAWDLGRGEAFTELRICSLTLLSAFNLLVLHRVNLTSFKIWMSSIV